MRLRFAACRSTFICVPFVVVAVQISLNLLLSYCGEKDRLVAREIRLTTARWPNWEVSSRPSPTDEKSGYIAERLRATERTLLSLERQLKRSEETRENITERLRNENAELTSRLAKFAKLEKIVSAQEFNKVKTEISKADFLKGDTLANEFEVVPFDSFTASGIYSVNKEGILNRPSIRPLGTRYKEHNEVLKFALRALNDEVVGREKLTQADLDNGITRLDRLNGMQYNLFFTASKPNQYHRVKIRRPFSNLELVDSVETVDTSKEPINLILPLSGRLENFKIFLKRFADVCVRWDARVFLTVVYFGEKGKEELRGMLEDFENKEKFKGYKLIFAQRPFSRGAGLQKGVLAWEKGNNIMFFCDVDVLFTPDFLERCRLYTEPGKMVYYPIVYSLYNPNVVYNGGVPPIESQLHVGKDNGFWRDFGFGMTCQYRNDFIASKGFDTTIEGWGKEDVRLYRQFIRMDVAVIRATDRGIFHLYHPKHCDPVLSSKQYLDCLGSKAVTEGSHRQMGMLAFGTRLFSNYEPDWRTKLLYSPDFSRRDSKIKSDKARKLWRRADELDIETLEIKLMKKRLDVATNFTVLDRNIFEFNGSVLNELQSSIEKGCQVVKQLARWTEKNHTIHETVQNTTS